MTKNLTKEWEDGRLEDEELATIEPIRHHRKDDETRDKQRTLQRKRARKEKSRDSDV